MFFIGFKSWRKVNNGKNCAFLKHIGKDPCSPHNIAVSACQDLLNQNFVTLGMFWKCKA